MLDLACLPPVRGRLMAQEPLAPFTWFRVGGPADVLFLPADRDDLAAFLAALPGTIQVTVLGAGSNVIVRDAGIAGVVIRLAGKGFGASAALSGARISVGAGVPDAALARAAAKAGVAGLEFYVGVPGAVGGALTMNAGCYGRETKDVLVSATAVDRAGQIHTLTAADFGFSYRSNALAPGLIFTDAVFQGEPGEESAITGRMAEITAMREASQPIRDKTGGSTFKNPPGDSAWKLIDRAGFRGARRGGAQVSEKHCNFLINANNATAADLEGLGEEVRAGVMAAFGVELQWEVKRIGRPGQANIK